MKKTLAIASDHAGYRMKLDIRKHLEEKGYTIIDFGTDSSEPVDYPDFGHPLANAVESGKVLYGISLCGSGNGITRGYVGHCVGTKKYHGWQENIMMPTYAPCQPDILMWKLP